MVKAVVTGKHYVDTETGCRFTVLEVNPMTLVAMDEDGTRRLLNRWMCESAWIEEGGGHG